MVDGNRSEFVWTTLDGIPEVGRQRSALRSFRMVGRKPGMPQAFSFAFQLGLRAELVAGTKLAWQSQPPFLLWFPTPFSFVFELHKVLQ